VLGAAECFALGVPPGFEQEDMPVMRQRIIQVLMMDDLVARAEL